MIIPIGLEHNTVRRLPWVTFGIMAACVAIFLMTKAFESTMTGGIEKDFGSAVHYFLEHPYLELDPDLERILFQGVGEDKREAFLESLRQHHQPPRSASQRRAEQEKLDELAAGALNPVRAHPFYRWGLIPRDPSTITFISHMFLHAGWLHLLGNLLLLYLAGPFLEDVWGRPFYAALYVLSGIVAALVFMARRPELSAPMIGASGAIAGIMGAFLVRYSKTRIKFFYMIFLFIRGTFTAPAWLMLPLWFLAQFLMANLTDTRAEGTGGGVAYWAHVGGFGFGVAVALTARYLQVEERYIRPAIESKVTSTVVSNPVVDRAMEAHSAGSSDEAFRLLAEEVRHHPHNQEAARALWMVAEQQGRTAEAAPLMVPVIRESLRRGETEMALEHWLALEEQATGLEVEAGLLVRLAQALAQNGRRQEATVTVRRAMLAATSGMNSAVALRIARAARDLDPGVARVALQLALQRPDLDPAERARAEELLAGLPRPLAVAPEQSP